MKAVQLVHYGDAIKAFQLSEIADPIVKSNEVLIEVEAFGLNFADVMARKKLYKAAPPIPCVLGYEVVGKVIAVSSGIDQSLIGKRVLAFTRFGGYAQKVAVSKDAIVEIGADDDAAVVMALATQYCTAYYSATIATNVQPGDTVLQHAAAGGVGLALTQLCKLKGAKVIGLVSDEQKKKFCLANGCDDVIIGENYSEMLLSKGIRPDVIFNSVAGKSFQRDLKLISPGGRLVCYGAADRLKGGGSFFATLKFVLQMKRIIPVKLLMASQSVIGINMLQLADLRPDYLKTCMHDVYKLYSDKKISPVVHQVYEVSEIAKAHSDFENRKTIGKLVIKW